MPKIQIINYPLTLKIKAGFKSSRAARRIAPQKSERFGVNYKFTFYIQNTSEKIHSGPVMKNAVKGAGVRETKWADELRTPLDVRSIFIILFILRSAACVKSQAACDQRIKRKVYNTFIRAFPIHYLLRPRIHTSRVCRAATRVCWKMSQQYCKYWAEIGSTLSSHLTLSAFFHPK